MLVEEFDILLLGLLAGGWARLSWRDEPTASPRSSDGAGRVWWAVALIYLGFTTTSVWNGLHDAGAWSAGAFQWSWWHGWREPMNVLRTAKPLALAVLTWPLWQALQARCPDSAARAVAWGAWGGLGVVSAAATWERWAWPGLTNFSTDYRTTALFWETHTGGAALDGFLALLLPFGLWGMASARMLPLSPQGPGLPGPGPRGGARNLGAALRFLESGAAMGVLALAFYAVLTTFTRSLYLAVMAGGVVWWVMHWYASPVGQRPSVRAHVARPAAWVLVFALAATVAFPGSGWRGQAALLGAMALLFYGWHNNASSVGLAGRTVASCGIALALTVPLVQLATGLPVGAKAPYVLYAVLACLTVWAWSRPRAWPVGWWLWTALLASAVGVAAHWGEGPGRWSMVPGVVILLLSAIAGAVAPAWRGKPGMGDGSQWRMLTLGAMTCASLVVGSFSGGAYLDSRLAATGQDWDLRIQHWTRALDLAQGTDDARWWGIGPGRFAAHYARSGESIDQVGDYRYERPGPSEGQLLLTSGRHMLGFGEMFRMSQRVASPVGELRVRWRAETAAPVRLHLEVCSKHLLYAGGCTTSQVQVGGPDDAPTRGWQEGGVTLKALEEWRQPVFSVALASPAGWVRLDDLHLTDSQGDELLHNGSFDHGLARWLPSSDRHHLPWHAKNLALHLRIEQGWLGLIGFTALLAFAIARLTLGRARRHPLAPPLLAGIVGFLIVGAFDSLLDIPRVAFAFLWLLGVAATLRSPGPAAAVSGPARTSRSGPR